MSRMPALLLLALPVSALADAPRPVDLPANFVMTRTDNYLLGQPKRVITLSSDRRGTEDKYNKDGVLVSHIVGTAGLQAADSESYKLDMVRGKLREVMYTPSNRGGYGNLNIKVLQTDDEGRVTALGGQVESETNRTASMLREGADNTVTVITYEPGKQKHSRYLNRQLQSTVTFEFSEDGRRLRESCAPKCRSNNEFTTEYGPHGPVRHQLNDTETLTSYENGAPVSIIIQKAGSGDILSARYFEHYVFDDCGNWTARDSRGTRLSLEDGAPRFKEMRKIEYFKDCPARAKPAP